MTRRLEVVLTALIIAALVVVALLVAWPYAMTRIIHIDEFNNLYSARLLDVYRDSNAAMTVETYMFPIAWLTRDVPATFEMLATLRVLFFGLLVGGILLMPLGLPGWRPLERVTLLAVSLLCVPLWRHGIEVRHDALLGVGFTALFVLTERARADGVTVLHSAAAGAMAVFMQLNAHKGFALGAPALLLMLVVVWRRGDRVGRTAAFVALGALATLGAVFALYAAEDRLTLYVDGLAHFSDYSRAAGRFSGAPSLWYLARTSPVQTALALLAVAAAVPRVRRRELDAVVLGAAFFLVSLMTWYANPNPYPYNLSWFGFGVLAGASQGLRVVWTRAKTHSPAFSAAVAVIAALSAAVTLHRDAFLSVKLDGQRALIEAAELLTAPDQPVLDLGGLVASRPPPSRDWLVHSLLMREYQAGRRENVCTIADKAAPPVIVRYYRWNWIPPEQVAELEKTYVAVTDQLWVLGCRGTGEHTCRMRREGRFLLRGAATIDGAAREDGAIFVLSAGEHVIHSAQEVQVSWLGPVATTLPEVPRFEPLFQGNDL